MQTRDPGRYLRCKVWVTTALLVLAIGCARIAAVDTYTEARTALIAAYEAQDFAAMQAAAGDALGARPGYPGARFNLALAKSLDGDHAGALEILQALVLSGVDFGVADIEEMLPLQRLAGWAAYAAAVAELQQPVGDAGLAFSYDRGDFIPEGILWLRGELLLGSVRHGSIVRIGATATEVSNAQDGGHWSVFGMRLGPDGAVWFASAAVPEFVAVDDATRGATGLFRLDLVSGEVMQAAMLPRTDTDRVFGDLVFADDDTIYLSESLRGELYRYTLSSGQLQQVIAAGAMRSLQGLVVDASGDYLYVADYVGGLYRVRLADFALTRITADDTVNLFGIDGLYRYGGELIAIQNGTRPHRVVALALADDGRSISASRVLASNLAEFDEPTLGTVVGDEFLFVANSHWNRFDREARLPDDLRGPVVLSVSLRRSAE